MYTIQSVKQAYALPKSSLVVALIKKGLLFPVSPQHWTRDELVTNWLRFYGEEEVDNVVVGPCGHKPTEDCMNCTICGRCSESLNEEDICASCLEEEEINAVISNEHIITDTAGRSYMLADEEGLR